MHSLWMQCKFETIRILRNPYYVFWSLFIPILFYFLFTKVFTFENPNITNYKAHLLMSMTTFSVMGSGIMTLGIRLVEERSKGWLLFMQTTPLSPKVYFFSKMFSQSIIHIISVVVIFFVGGVVNSVALSFSEWLFAGIWIIIGSLPFLAIGTLIGTIKRVDTATGISNVLYMALAMTGGMWMPIEIMPSYIQKVSVWLPAFNLGNGAWAIVSGSAPEFKNVLILIGYLFLFMLLSSYIRRKQNAVV
ncbi:MULTISPECIES: ABC transporter permease [Bacillus]|uniref:ABC transporter permease n=1 Tax=Bacillus TaxID=1386 RepID=UPI00030EFA8F|nr:MULTISPECIES: ABC transporter permease [Bacillus]